MKYVAIMFLALVGLVEVIARGVLVVALICTIIGIIYLVESESSMFDSHAFGLARGLANA